MLKIVVDSTADLPQELIVQHDIDIISLSVHMNDKEYKDKKEIVVDEVYNALREGTDVKTSQPNPSEIIEVLETHLKNKKDVIVITLSSKLSGGNQVINMVANQLMDEYKDARIHVIDSKGGAAVPGILALQASLLSKKKYNTDRIVDILNDLANHCEHIFTIADLKYLIKGGRITKAEAFIGNVLKVKPILTVNDGAINLYKKVRGKRKVLTTIIDMVDERIKEFPNQIVGVCHADDEDMAKEVEALLRERYQGISTYITTIGSVLATHIGIGGIGILFFNKEPESYIQEI